MGQRPPSFERRLKTISGVRQTTIIDSANLFSQVPFFDALAAPVPAVCGALVSKGLP